MKSPGLDQLRRDLHIARAGLSAQRHQAGAAAIVEYALDQDRVGFVNPLQFADHAEEGVLIDQAVIPGVNLWRERQVEKSGKALKDTTLEEMERYWQEAKRKS